MRLISARSVVRIHLSPPQVKRERDGKDRPQAKRSDDYILLHLENRIKREQIENVIEKNRKKIRKWFFQIAGRLEIITAKVAKTTDLRNS